VRRPLQRLQDWLGKRRNAWVTRPAFRDRAARFPLTRPVARREAARLFDLCAGFVYSQVLLAVVRLGLIDFLADGPRNTSAIAAHAKLPEDNAQVLLAAAAALDLIHARADGRWQLGPLGAALVGNKALDAMIRHHAILYADLADPVELLRGDGSGTRLSQFWTYAREAAPSNAKAAETYSDLMAATQPLVASEILNAVPLADRRCLMDVGGGSGGFLISVAARHPHLNLMLFDLPNVAALAETRLAAAGLSTRALVHAGSFHQTGALPHGADTISLVRVLHDHDDAAALALLKKCRAALPPDGLLMLAEPMADAPGAGRMGHAYFGLYLHAMGSGRPRTVQENKDLLAAAGFRNASARPTDLPIQVQILVAQA
jgi:demethylspheroidene O-methyltransferase